MAKIHMTPAACHRKPEYRVLDNQNGSVMVLVLMALVVLTAIGIMSSDTVVNEKFITRNVGLYKQNVNMLESALMEGLQRFMQIPDNNPANFDPVASVWISDQNNAADPLNQTWYELIFTNRLLNAANSNNANTLPLLTLRGEAANANLRYGVLGFGPAVLGTGGRGGSESLVMGGPVWHQGRILAEYISLDGGGNNNGNGLLRMEIGVKRMW